MEQSFLDRAAATTTTTPQLFNFNSPAASVLLRLTTQASPRPSVHPSLAALPVLLNPTTMSHAALGSAVRFPTNSSLSPDPPAAGPPVASLPSTNRVRAAVSAAHAQAVRRNMRNRREAGHPPVSSQPAAAATATAPTASASSEPPEPPRRSCRNRKRAPASASAAAGARFRFRQDLLPRNRSVAI